VRASERFNASRHDITGFSSTNASLDRWLTVSAGQSQRRDAARTFVALAADDRTVIGYYTLVVGELAHEQATATVRRGLNRHFPIPVAILARLAVDTAHQGQGLGAALLSDALARVITAAEELAVRAVIVHAIDDTAAGFYEHHGFRALGDAPRTLMVTLAELRAAGYA
jgi:GNAT superfamily N-acetyltransferase